MGIKRCERAPSAGDERGGVCERQRSHIAIKQHRNEVKYYNFVLLKSKGSDDLCLAQGCKVLTDSSNFHWIGQVFVVGLPLISEEISKSGS